MKNWQTVLLVVLAPLGIPVVLLWYFWPQLLFAYWLGRMVSE